MADTGSMRVGAYALCLDEAGRLLLARVSASFPDGGSWTMPGGGIDHGEPPHLAVLRELREETGLHAGSVGDVVGIYSRLYTDRGDHPGFHHVGIVYRVLAEGEPRAEANGSTDLSRWFGRHEVRSLALTPLGEFGRSIAWPDGEGENT